MIPYLTLHDPQSAARYYEDGVWTRDTFYSLLVKWADTYPDQSALRDGWGTLSWKELRARVDGMADDLAAQGLTQGDPVSIWMTSRVEVVITFLACSRNGLACNPSLHKTYTCAEIITLLKRLNTAVLVTEPGWGADRTHCDFDAMLGDVGSLRKVYTPDTFPAAADEPARAYHDNPDTISYLAFTSGTTGVPKCVMHSANTLMSNCRDLVADWGVNHETVILSLSPLSHHIGWVAVGQWLTSGGCLVTENLRPGVSQLDWLVESGASYVLGVPTHAMDVLQAQKQQRLQRLGKVQTFYMAGAAIPEVVAEAFGQQGIRPQNVYGMTETSSHQYTHPDDDPSVWVPTCGRGGKSYEIAIFDMENPDLPAPLGETGQIGGRGGLLMLGYMGNQDATGDSFNRDGWFLSGDLGSLDKAGNLTVQGRLKDLIIRGGHNIYPSHIEAAALRHDDIELAAAIAIADDRLGERVCLAVKSALDADQVLAHLAGVGLSKYDMPEWFLPVDDFPKTASGKVLKRELEAMVKRGEFTPQRIGKKG